MKRTLWTFLSLFLFALLPALVLASGFKPPALTGRVVDQTGVLSRKDVRKIEDAIRNLEAATGGQMAVAFLDGLGGSTIEQAGIALGDAWKIGRKGRDDGAILIVVPDERVMRLEIGYGWEGCVNDARAGDIIRDLQKFFREKDYAGGAAYAVGKVQEFVTGSAPGDLIAPPQDESDYDVEEVGYFILFIILLFLPFFHSKFTGGGGFKGGGGGFGGFGGGFKIGGGFKGGGGGFGGGGASGRW